MDLVLRIKFFRAVKKALVQSLLDNRRNLVQTRVDRPLRWTQIQSVSVHNEVGGEVDNDSDEKQSEQSRASRCPKPLS